MANTETSSFNGTAGNTGTASVQLENYNIIFILLSKRITEKDNDAVYQSIVTEGFDA